MGVAYSFVSRWEAPASPERCWDELVRTLQAGGGSWWRALSVSEPPAALAEGETLGLAVRSPLGYRLRVGLTLTDVREGALIAAASDGDLRGRGRVELVPMGARRTEILWGWDVTTERTWMNAAAVILRPAFARAHHAVMRAGERGMRAALAVPSEHRPTSDDTR